MTGPVVFTVAAGTYTEHIIIPAITGASSLNTITFDGVDPLTRIISFASTVAGDYTIRLNGADYIRILNLGIENQGVTYGFPVQLMTNADNNIVSGCRLLMPTTTTASGKVGVVTSTSYTSLSSAVTNLTLSNNTIIGGYVGIAVNGSTGSLSTGVVIDGNTITDPYYTGLYVSYLNLMSATGNAIAMRQGYTSGYGAQLRNLQEFTFARNSVIRAGLYGVYVFTPNQSSNSYSNLVNNMVGGGFQTTGTSYGLYISTPRYLNIHHNSVLCDNLNGSGARALFVTGTMDNLDIQNNSFATTVTGATSYALYMTNTTGVNALGYNNYYSAGSNLAYFVNSNYPNLGALQSGWPFFNTNCQSNWPNYVSSTNLHTWGAPLSNWATGLATSVDFDNQMRPLPPDLINDVGADEFNIPPVDVDINQIVSPVVPALGPNTVQVQLQNNGSNSLNGSPITLQYSTDGGTTWAVTQTFTPTTMASIGTQETFTFSTPWTITLAGSYNFCVRISPSILGDPDASDQTCIGVCTGMLGTYTVNGALATGGTNFNSFYDLASALGGCGISGPVLVNVAPGVYNQTFTIGYINGTSNVNTVTIDGGDTSLVTIQSSISTANGSVVTLDSADWVTFRSIKFNSLGVTYGSCLKLTNAADHNTVDSCVMVLPSNATSAYHIGVVASGATYSTFQNSANYFTMSNSIVRNGYYGARMNGINTTSYCDGNRFINNKFIDFYYYGIYSYYQSNPHFLDNTIIGRTSGTFTTFANGLYMYYNQGNLRVEGNTIHSIGTYGLYMSYANNNNSGTGKVLNNMIGANFQSTSTAYGIYVNASRDIDFYHNSVRMSGGTGYCMYITASPPNTDSLRIVNNILSGGGYFLGGGSTCLYVLNAASIQTLNYNMYYTNGTTLASWSGLTFGNLTLWRNNVPQHNQNSIEDDPGFIGVTNLHVVCSPADNLGTPIGITLDIDEQTRSLTNPDMGADEFTGITVTTSLGPDTAFCGTTRIYADTVAFQTFLWGGGQTSDFLIIDSTGTYSVYAIDSNNCRASDTIVVVIDSLPSLPYNNDTVTVCNTTILDAQNAGGTFLWSNGATTQTTTPATAGNYYVTVTTPAGCSLVDTVTVNLNPNPNLNLGPDTTFCLGGLAVLNAGNGLTGTTYQWSTGATTQVIVVNNPGAYAVTVTSPFGCTSSDTIGLQIVLAPVVSLGPDRTLCGPGNVLDAGNPGASYVWSNGATTQTVPVTTTGNYSVTVTNAVGCSSQDNVNITVSPVLIVEAGSDTMLCNGQNMVLNAGHPGSGYNWSTGANTQSITVAAAGTYLVTVTAPNGCQGVDTVNITFSNLSVNLGPNTNICQGGYGTINAGNSGSNFLWSTGETTQWITVTQPGTYSVTVTDQFGCTAGDNIILNQVPGITAAFTAPATANVFFPVQFTDQSSGSVNTWDWDFNDGTFSTQQNPVHNFAALGVYNVRLIATDGFCRDTFMQIVDVNQYVNADEGSFASSFDVYPNPSTGMFHYQLELYRRGEVTMEVLDLAGRVLHQDVLRSAVSYSGDLDLSHLSKGVYLLSLTSNGSRMMVKLVIQ
ncbi:MAG: PKD domain-containing protein [Bacteroidia bacterium]